MSLFVYWLIVRAAERDQEDAHDVRLMLESSILKHKRGVGMDITEARQALEKAAIISDREQFHGISWDIPVKPQHLQVMLAYVKQLEEELVEMKTQHGKTLSFQG